MQNDKELGKPGFYDMLCIYYKVNSLSQEHISFRTKMKMKQSKIKPSMI